MTAGGDRAGAGWWVLSSRYGALHAAPGETAAEALAWVQEGIVDAFLSEGLSRTAALRGAGSYDVCVVAGGCTEQEARAAEGWDGGDLVLAQRLHDRWVAGTRRKRMNLAGRGLRDD